MAEAPIKWKVATLREFNSARTGGYWIPKPETQEEEWFLDIMKDGFIEAKHGYFSESPPKVGMIDFYQPPPNGFYDFHVTEKGKKLIEDYDAKMTFRGITNRWTFPSLKWILIAVLGRGRSHNSVLSGRPIDSYFHLQALKTFKRQLPQSSISK